VIEEHVLGGENLSDILILLMGVLFLDLGIIQRMMDKFIVNLIFFNYLLSKEIILRALVLIIIRHVGYHQHHLMKIKFLFFVFFFSILSADKCY
jgi:hypothetical protein